MECKIIFCAFLIFSILNGLEFKSIASTVDLCGEEEAKGINTRHMQDVSTAVDGISETNRLCVANVEESLANLQSKSKDDANQVVNDLRLKLKQTRDNASTSDISECLRGQEIVIDSAVAKCSDKQAECQLGGQDKINKLKHKCNETEAKTQKIKVKAISKLGKCAIKYNSYTASCATLDLCCETRKVSLLRDANNLLTKIDKSATAVLLDQEKCLEETLEILTKAQIQLDIKNLNCLSSQPNLPAIDPNLSSESGELVESNEEHDKPQSGESESPNQPDEQGGQSNSGTNQGGAEQKPGQPEGSNHEEQGGESNSQKPGSNQEGGAGQTNPQEPGQSAGSNQEAGAAEIYPPPGQSGGSNQEGQTGQGNSQEPGQSTGANQEGGAGQTNPQEPGQSAGSNQEGGAVETNPQPGQSAGSNQEGGAGQTNPQEPGQTEGSGQGQVEQNNQQGPGSNQTEGAAQTNPQQPGQSENTNHQTEPNHEGELGQTNTEQTEEHNTESTDQTEPPQETEQPTTEVDETTQTNQEERSGQQPTS